MLRYLSLLWSFDQTPHFVQDLAIYKLSTALQEVETLILNRLTRTITGVFRTFTNSNVISRFVLADPEIDALSAF